MPACTQGITRSDRGSWSWLLYDSAKYVMTPSHTCERCIAQTSNMMVSKALSPGARYSSGQIRLPAASMRGSADLNPPF